MLLMCPTLTLTLNPKPRLPWSSAGSQSGASQRMQDQAEVVAIITKVRTFLEQDSFLCEQHAPKPLLVSAFRRFVVLPPLVVLAFLQSCPTFSQEALWGTYQGRRLPIAGFRV